MIRLIIRGLTAARQALQSPAGKLLIAGACLELGTKALVGIVEDSHEQLTALIARQAEGEDEIYGRLAQLERVVADRLGALADVVDADVVDDGPVDEAVIGAQLDAEFDPWGNGKARDDPAAEYAAAP